MLRKILKKEDKQILIFVAKLFLLLRLVTLFFAFLGSRLLDFKQSFPYAPSVLFPHGSPLFWSWANFDGVHYIRLAEYGYAFGLTQAYFPLYFLLMRFFNLFFRHYLFSGLFISHLFFFFCFFIFYKLLKLDLKKEQVKKTLLLMVIFPTAFFFLSLYTESLFLTLIFLSFYLARKKHWLWAGIIGALSSACRVTGVFLIPALLIEYWQQKPKKKRISFKNLIFCCLPGFGLLVYMYFLQSKFSDPLMFVHSQPGFGAGRSVDKIVLLYQVFWRYLKMIFTVDPSNPIYFTVHLELWLTLLFLIVLILAIKKVRFSYLIFAALSFILPTLTGILSSMPRYLLTVFPVFIFLGSLKKNKINLILFIISFLLLAVCTMLFTRGYWVA